MVSFSKIFYTAFLLGLSLLAHSQKKNIGFEYRIHRTNDPVLIDGLENDAAWRQAEVATDFYQVLPMDTSRAVVRTEVRMLFDDQYLYLLAVNYNKLSGPYMVESLRRDFNFEKNDNFVLFIDPFDDQTNGFAFGANARGAQWDGLLFNGGDIDLSWENKWESVVKAADDLWVLEMAIPFKTLRYKKGTDRWGVNFSRSDLKTTETSAWAPVPRQFPTASLAYTGVLVWDEPPPQTGANVSLIPYAIGGVSKDLERNGDAEFLRGFGGDVKVALNSSLNLDLTVNPDFSQVEVDEQQTNLDRFELFFPERRQFFLENADLFGNFGYSTMRPFFSRRIGLNAPILFGARLSGKLNKDWRIGGMTMQSEKDGEGTPAQNFSVLSLQRRVFSRSNVSAIFVNKETFNYEDVADKDAIKRYNRNLGLEYNLASSNNKWKGKMLWLQSFSPGKGGNDHILAGNLGFYEKQWYFDVELQNIGENFRAETGFVPRTGYNRMGASAGWQFFPKSNVILNHGPQTFFQFIFDKNMRYIETEFPIIYSVTFLNTSAASVWVAYDSHELDYPFDPTNFVGDTVAAGTRHIWKSFGTEYVSKPQSIFTWSFNSRYGGYYADGTRLFLRGEVGYRFQPYVALGVATEYNRIAFGNDDRLPDKLKNQNFEFWLVGPRLDVTVTNKLFLTNFIQYNGQEKNVNLNLRFQWRYSPASDLFIVYTNNYLSDFSDSRNWALVLKMTYWWNI